MKKAIILSVAALGLVSVSAFGQGKVSFNLSTLSPVPIVTNGVTGATLNNTFRAQLFYGTTADASAMTPVWYSTTGPGTQTPYTFLIPGLIADSAAKYTDPARVDAGGTGFFQVRAWTAALGADYATAFAAWSSQPADPSRLLGQSVVVQVSNIAGTVGNPTPPLPSNLVGMQSFGVFPVPEPSVIALGLIGLGVLAWRRRK